MRKRVVLAVGAVVVLAVAGGAVVLANRGPEEFSEPVAGKSGVGVPPGTVLRRTGSLTADEPGAVLAGLDVRGMVTVTAPGVVIRDSRFTGDGSTPWAVRTEGAGSVRIEDTTITGDYTDAGISYHHWTAVRVEITGMTNDGAKLGRGVTLTDSWLHDFAPSPGAHSDGAQLTEDVGDIVVERNRIDVGTAEGANAALFLSPDIGGDDPGAGPIVVRDNTLGGGAYTFGAVDGANGATLRDVTVTGNTFVPGARYGPVYPNDPRRVSESGNVFADGSPVPWP